MSFIKQIKLLYKRILIEKNFEKDYSGLEEWIEIVLFEKDCKRLEKKGWRIRPEIVDLLNKIDHTERKTTIVDEEFHDKNHEVTGDNNSRINNDSELEYENIETKDNVLPSNDHMSSKPHPTNDINSSPHQTKNKTGGKKILPEHESDGSIHSQSFNFIEEFKKPFNRPAEFQQNDDFETKQYPLNHPDRRRYKENKRLKEKIDSEPDSKDRRIKTKRTILEKPNPQTRKIFTEWYNGQCQICGHTFKESSGEPFFIAKHIVQRHYSRTADDYANALCLCAEHFAQFQHGTIESDDVLEQVQNKNNGCMINIKLCGEKCQITFDQRHMIAMQELLQVQYKSISASF